MPCDRGDADARKLKSKVKALAKALATLSEEKKTIETRFQADKKKVADAHRAALQQLKDESGAKIATLDTRLENAAAERDGFKANVQQLTEQLMAGHAADKARSAEWDKERRALQDEVKAAEKGSEAASSDRAMELEQKLRQARDNELEALTQLSTTTTELKDKISELEEELATTTKQLVAEQNKGESAELLQLKQELQKTQGVVSKYKSQAAAAAQQQAEAARAAQKRVEQSEAKLSNALKARTEKEEVDSRSQMTQEDRLAELAALVGSYEAVRAKDLAEIKQLTDENAELVERVRCAEEEGVESGAGAGAGGPGAAERAAQLEATVARLTAKLQAANQRLAEGHAAAADALGAEPDVVAPPWGADTSDSNPELQQAKEFGDDMYKKVVELCSAKAEAVGMMRQHQQGVEELRKLLAKTQREADAAIAEMRATAESAVHEAESRLVTVRGEVEAEHVDKVRETTKRHQEVRDRSLELLSERDAEIARLRAQVYRGRRSTGGRGPAAGSSADEAADTAGAAAQLAEAAALEVDELTMGGPLLHPALEEHERDCEEKSVRAQLRELEVALNDAQYKDELREQQCERLKEEIRRLDANNKREGANLEYLKNVIVHFMKDDVGTEQTILAIATILQFSRKELADVKKKASRSTWFGSS